MAYCKKCGKELKEGEKECSNCSNEKFNEFFETKDETKDYTKKDIKDNKAMAILSYFGPLVLLPFFTAGESKFAMFHAKQGMTLFIIWIVYYFLSGLLSLIKVPGPCGGPLLFNDMGHFCNVTPWWIAFPLKLIALLLVIIAIIGVINVCQGKAKELPFVGKIKIFK